MAVGVTVVDGKAVVSPALVYHATVPAVQVALNTELPSAQIVAGAADTLVAAVGVGVTVTVTWLPKSLTQPLPSHLT